MGIQLDENSLADTERYKSLPGYTKEHGGFVFVVCKETNRSHFHVRQCVFVLADWNKRFGGNRIVYKTLSKADRNSHEQRQSEYLSDCQQHALTFGSFWRVNWVGELRTKENKTRTSQQKEGQWGDAGRYESNVVRESRKRNDGHGSVRVWPLGPCHTLSPRVLW